jgi:hypothetical protein
LHTDDGIGAAKSFSLHHLLGAIESVGHPAALALAAAFVSVKVQRTMSRIATTKESGTSENGDRGLIEDGPNPISSLH